MACGDCGGVLRKFGPSWRNGVCLHCYQTLMQETWETYYPNFVEPTCMPARTLFIGNLPYTTTDEEVTALVRELMLDTRGIEEKPDNFTVRCCRGGPTYTGAFVQFDLVRDSCKLFEKCKDSKQQFGESGRWVTAHPSMVAPRTEINRRDARKIGMNCIQD